MSGKSEWGCLQTLGPTQRPGAGKRQGSQWRVHIQLPSDAWAAASRPGSHHTGTSAPRAPALPTGTCPSRPCLAEACEGIIALELKTKTRGALSVCSGRWRRKRRPCQTSVARFVPLTLAAYESGGFTLHPMHTSSPPPTHTHSRTPRSFLLCSKLNNYFLLSQTTARGEEKVTPDFRWRHSLEE